MACSTICSNLMQKKDPSTDMMRKDLRKVLHLSDLTFLAIGSMIGSGLYVLTGSIARDVAGPSIVLSYTIAAMASALSAVCYAEFAARIPITGSAYQFTYLSIGEIWAYFIGWNVFIEHAVSVAAIARAWSGYVDGMFGHPIKKYLIEHLPMPGGLLADYPDFLAGGLVIILTIIVAFGVKVSSKFNIVFATLNLVVIIFIFCTGMYLAKGEYWTAKGAFFPFGWSGTISGASTLIFSYVGYEVVASATEEAVNPKRDVPLSLLISLSVVVVAYVGASAALTLMVPWKEIVVASPFPSAYQTRGWNWAKYIVSIGALAAMTTAMLSAMLVVPRYMYAMARDGLLMAIFTKIYEKSGVPIVGTIVSGIFIFILTIVFSLLTLVEFISIGQLTACTFVAICVIKLRYGPNVISSYESLEEDTVGDTGEGTELQNVPNSAGPSTSANNLESETIRETNYKSTNNETIRSKNKFKKSEDGKCGVVKNSILESRCGFLFEWTLKFQPGEVPFYALLVAIFFSIISASMLLFSHGNLTEWWFILLLIIFLTIVLAALLLITTFNKDQTMRTFKVPLLPWIPFASIVINIILIMKLNPLTWARFGAWMLIGLILYIAYGYRHSKSRNTE